MVPVSLQPAVAALVGVPVVGPLTKTGLPPVRLPLRYYIVGEEGTNEWGVGNFIHKGDIHTLEKMIVRAPPPPPSHTHAHCSRAHPSFLLLAKRALGALLRGHAPPT